MTLMPRATRTKRVTLPPTDVTACKLCVGTPFTVPVDDKLGDYKMAAHQVRKHRKPLGAKSKKLALEHLDRVRQGVADGTVLAIGVTTFDRHGTQSGFRQAGAPTRCAW